VQANVISTGYPAEHLPFNKGKGRGHNPGASPSQLPYCGSLLIGMNPPHELIHLFPKISVGGVLIIDDYGFWEGARKAVDEYIEANHLSILLKSD
jgi:O-methyltransferase